MADNIRVLAVDDAVANLAIIKGCLRNGNFELTTESNALKALQTFKKHFFDVVLLDVLMPGISGFELRKLIRQVDLERPIIFLTGMGDDMSKTMLEQISWDPFTFYLDKKIDRDTLTRKIADVTQAHKMRQMDKLKILRIEEELRVAGHLQKLFLPPWCIADPNMVAGSVYIPALLASGDIYDIVKIAGDRYLFFIGDISGHGISAALYMSTIQKYLKDLLTGKPEISVNDILNELNHFVCRKVKNNVYLTAMVVIVDFNKNHLSLHNAGHLPLLCCSPTNRSVAKLESSAEGLPLGWFESTEYLAKNNLEYDFNDDCIFIAMTDGLLNIENDNQQPLQQQELYDLLATQASQTDAVLLPNKIIQTIRELAYRRQNDDITILAFQKRIACSDFIEQVIPAQLPFVDSIAALFSQMTDNLQQQAQIELCLHEFLNNVIIHGNRHQDNDSPIYVSMKNLGNTFQIRIIDSGEPWNFTQQCQSPAADEDNCVNTNLVTSGRGIYILQSIAKDIGYHSYDGINEAVFTLNETGQ